ncbi:hypothetical protein Tco_0092864, partial [Tanacetum coccineum]
MPSFLSPEPKLSFFDDLDYLKDFENEFPAIFYNDALTSKSDFLTEPTMCPQHVDEFNLKDETSLSKCNKEEQNILYFNDLFPFNIIYPDGLKSDEDNDDMALPPRDQRHQYLRFEDLGYTDADSTDFEERLGRIYDREIHRGQSIFTSRAWRRIFKIRGSLVHELILEFFSTFRFGEVVVDLDTTRALQFQLGGVRLIAYSIAGRSQEPEKVTVTDLFYLRGMDVGSVNIPYLLARYLRFREEVWGDDIWRLICEELDDTWAWVAPGPERQQVDAAGALEVAKGAPDVDEGDQAVLAHVQAPQAPAARPARTMAQMLERFKEDVHGMRGALGEQREVLDGMAYDFSRFTTWMVTGLSPHDDQAGVRIKPG